jgi:hypothetical protein
MEDVMTIGTPVSLFFDVLPSLFREERKHTRSVSFRPDTTAPGTALFLGIDFIKKTRFFTLEKIKRRF